MFGEKKKKEVVRTWRICVQCKQNKLMAHRSIRCKDCLKDNRDKKFVDKKNKIADNPEDRLYLLSLPIARREWDFYPEDEVRTWAVYVHPYEYYDGIQGTELIRLYLNPKDNKRYGKTDVTRKFESRYRKRFGNLTQADIERLTKLGNTWNDSTFEKFNVKANEKSGNERKGFVNSYRGKTIESFSSSNEALGIRYKEEGEKILAELRKQDKEEAEDEGEMDYDAMEDENG